MTTNNIAQYELWKEQFDECRTKVLNVEINRGHFMGIENYVHGTVPPNYHKTFDTVIRELQQKVGDKYDLLSSDERRQADQYKQAVERTMDHFKTESN